MAFYHILLIQKITYEDDQGSVLGLNHLALAFRFPGVDWILGNHSDELTPWIPVMACLSGMFMNRAECKAACRLHLIKF